MKTNTLTIAFFMVIAAFISGPGICLAENNSINISYAYDAGFCDDLNQFSVEYEYLLKNTKISLLGRYSIADYKIEDAGSSFYGRIGEDGDLKGFDFGFRFYPTGQKTMNRLFLGGAIGFYQNDWEESSYGYDQGAYSENVTRLDTEIGYRFYMSSERVSLIPSAHLGYFFRDSSTLGIYAGISISVGVVF